jgi:PAS domain S-box-containing protein
MGMPEKRILIVEDERIVAEDLKRLLVKLGYAVTGIAASGEEAIQSVRTDRPDLVLMDIRIQGPQDGIDVAEHLYAEYDVPVSYLTAFADAPTLDRAKATLPFGYILKPFETRSLQVVIELAIHRHRMERVVNEMDGWHARALASVADAVIATDRAGLLIYMNKAAEKISGWTPDAMFGKPLSALLTGSKNEPLPSRVGNSPVEGPGILRTKKGGSLQVLFTRTFLDGEDGPSDRELIVVREA